MKEQVKNILVELKAIQTKLPELRDLFWLKIDRYNEADQQRGVAFDEKFEQQRDKLFRMIDNFSAFIERSFAPSVEEVSKDTGMRGGVALDNEYYVNTHSSTPAKKGCWKIFHKDLILI